jgi:hypothetical protein
MTTIGVSHNAFLKPPVRKDKMTCSRVTPITVVVSAPRMSTMTAANDKPSVQNVEYGPSSVAGVNVKTIEDQSVARTVSAPATYSRDVLRSCGANGVLDWARRKSERERVQP